MRLTPEQLSGFHPMQNYVLTCPVMRSDTVKIGETELYQDTTYNPGFHQPVVQRVLAVCKKLYYGREQRFVDIDQGFDAKIGHNRKSTFAINAPIRHSMEWDTDIEVKTGDIVWVDSLPVMTASSHNATIECEDKTYYLLKYSDLYLKLVEGIPYMLNGWILVATVDKPEDDLVKILRARGIIFPSMSINPDTKKQYGQTDKIGIVRYLSPPVREYLDPNIEDTEFISVGDTVVLALRVNRRLESQAHKWFSQEDLLVTRRPRIVAVVRDELF
jgi:hypothetical protein